MELEYDNRLLAIVGDPRDVGSLKAAIIRAKVVIEKRGVKTYIDIWRCEDGFYYVGEVVDPNGITVKYYTQNHIGYAKHMDVEKVITVTYTGIIKDAYGDEIGKVKEVE